MNRAGMWLVAGLWGAAVAGAESPGADSQMLAEVRQLRQDLQTAAATIQRAQIVMFRLQVQGAALGATRQRLERARFSCDQVPRQRQMTMARIERTEAHRRNTQNPAEQKTDEQVVLQLRSEIEAIAQQEQECLVQQAESATEFRNEEATMNDLQEQLERLDKTLAGYGKK